MFFFFPTPNLRNQDREFLIGLKKGTMNLAQTSLSAVLLGHRVFYQHLLALRIK